MTDKQELLMKKGNLKLSVFTSCPYDEIKKICDSIVILGYDCEFVDNGNIVFQKREDGDDEYETIKYDKNKETGVGKDKK